MTELYHHGVKRQRWGFRRYQNYDGTLTEEGKARLRKKAYKDAPAWNTKDGFIKKGTKFNRTIELRNRSKSDKEYKKEVKDSLNAKKVNVHLTDDSKEATDHSAHYISEYLTNPYLLYSRDFIVKNETKIASSRKLVDTIIDNLEEDENGSLKDLLKNKKKDTYYELMRKYNYDEKVNSTVNNQLAKEGYDAIYDPTKLYSENDQQTIFLNPQKTFSNKTNVKYGEQIVKELAKKGYKYGVNGVENQTSFNDYEKEILKKEFVESQKNKTYDEVINDTRTPEEIAKEESDFWKGLADYYVNEMNKKK